jgi:hypothetical protein
VNLVNPEQPSAVEIGEICGADSIRCGSRATMAENNGDISTSGRAAVYRILYEKEGFGEVVGQMGRASPSLN